MVDSIIKSFDIWTDAQGVKSKGRVKSIENISLEGIGLLRDLILELAIQGKLVEQDPNDEPANELMKKVDREREKVVEEGKLKKEKPLAKIKDEEKPFPLPEGWVIVRLAEVGVTQTGATPSTNNNEYFGDYIPFIGPADLNDGTVLYTNNGLSKKGLAKGRLIEKNSILMVCIGGSIGKARIVDRDVSCNQQINTVTCHKNILPEYVYKALSSPYFQKQILDKATGSATPIINKGKWENIPIPLPPLAEQKRIVAKVDELMSLCHKLEREKTASLKTHQLLVKSLLQTLTAAKDAGEVQVAWNHLAPHFDTLFCTEDSIDQLKQTILQLAVMGRLVKQDPADEPASELLKKVEKEKKRLVKEGKLKEAAPLPEIGQEERPFQLPSGWEWVRLKNLGYITGGGTPSTSNRSYWDGGNILWITPKDMKADYLEDAESRVTLDGVKNSSAKLIPPHSVLVVARSGILKRTLPVSINVVECVVNQDLKVLVPLHQGMERYIQLMLQGHEKFILKELVKYGMTVHSLLYEKFEMQPFPLPPLPEQKRIVAKLESLMSLCDHLKERLLKSQEIQNTLSKTIVENAVA
jgi:type I restriction enzyme S subunit